ncbi:DUF3930 family protein, partial [Bacillus anthracis]
RPYTAYVVVQFILSF